jgi:hypothetical protein
MTTPKPANGSDMIYYWVEIETPVKITQHGPYAALPVARGQATRCRDLHPQPEVHVTIIKTLMQEVTREYIS